MTPEGQWEELFSPLLWWKCVALKTLRVIFALLILVPDQRRVLFFFFPSSMMLNLLCDFPALNMLHISPFSWWAGCFFPLCFISQQCVTACFGARVEPGVILTWFSLGAYVLSSSVCSYFNTVLCWIPLPLCVWEKNIVAMQYQQDSTVKKAMNFNVTQKEKYYRKQNL